MFRSPIYEIKKDNRNALIKPFQYPLYSASLAEYNMEQVSGIGIFFWERLCVLKPLHSYLSGGLLPGGGKRLGIGPCWAWEVLPGCQGEVSYNAPFFICIISYCLTYQPTTVVLYDCVPGQLWCESNCYHQPWQSHRPGKEILAEHFLEINTFNVMWEEQFFHWSFIQVLSIFPLKLFTGSEQGQHRDSSEVCPREKALRICWWGW